MKVAGGNIHSIQGKKSKNESGHLVEEACHSRVRGKTLLAEECKQCTKLAIHILLIKCYHWVCYLEFAI